MKKTIKTNNRFTTKNTAMYNRRLIQTGKVVSAAPILTDEERQLEAYRNNDSLECAVVRAAFSCEATIGRSKGMVLAMVERVLSHEKQPVVIPAWDIAC